MFDWPRRKSARRSASLDDFQLLMPGDGQRLLSLYGPLNDLGAYVRQLQIHGVSRERLPTDFRSLAALEHYYGSIEGEGHALFRDNNDEFAEVILEDAVLGCDLLGLVDLKAAIRDFLPVLARDTRRVGTSLKEAEISSINESYDVLDKRVYDLKLSDAEVSSIPSQLPKQFHDAAERLLSKRDMYARNPVYLRGMVWVLNAPSLRWHNGPGYWEEVQRLAEVLSSPEPGRRNVFTRLRHRYGLAGQ